MEGPELTRRRSYRGRVTPITYESFVDFFDDKKKWWATEVKMGSSAPGEESDKKAAIKIGESLLKDWLKSAKKACGQNLFRANLRLPHSKHKKVLDFFQKFGRPRLDIWIPYLYIW
ncbi:MAG TPA: hypothetical protein VGB98_01655 [Pyrinomonadaceae bacterium]